MKTTINWMSGNFDLVPTDVLTLAAKQRWVSVPLMVGNSTTDTIYEECVRWDYDNTCWVKAFDTDDSDVECVPDVWAPWPTISG